MADRVDVALLLRRSASLVKEHCREWHDAFECCETDIRHLCHLADAVEALDAARAARLLLDLERAEGRALALLRGEVPRA